MKKTLVLLLFIPFGAFSQSDTIPDINTIMYEAGVSTRSMWHWYFQCKNYEISDSLQKEIINGYEQLTGVQARSTEDLKKAYEIKQEVSRASEDLLNAAIQGEKKAIRRKNFWKTVTIVGIPASAVGGFILATKIK